MKTAAQAAKFLARAGIVLRYGANAKLPLASMYAAVGDDRKATTLTNALIGDGTAIEVACVADRVCLAHASLAPALIALCRRGRAVDELALSQTARDVLGFLAMTERPTAGAVRAYIGVPPQTWPNPADNALLELQRAFVIDRGPTDVPATGAAYLSKDGIPYRLVDDVHAAHIRAAGKLTIERALDTVLGKLAIAKPRPLLKRIASAAEIDAALSRRR
jgi:hypothetical protein